MEEKLDGLEVDYKVNYVKQINNNGTEKVFVPSDFLLWEDSDFVNNPYTWYHSQGPYNENLRRMQNYIFNKNKKKRVSSTGLSALMSHWIIFQTKSLFIKGLVNFACKNRTFVIEGSLVRNIHLLFIKQLFLLHLSNLSRSTILVF